LHLTRTNHNNSATSVGSNLHFQLKDSGGTIREYAGIGGRKTEAGAAGGALHFYRYNRAELGYWNATGLYATAFYDSANTAYYVDPASFTELFGGIRNSGAHSTSQIINRLPAANNGAGTGIVQLQMWCSEPSVSWEGAGFGYNVTNDGGSPSGFGRLNTSFGQGYMRFASSGDIYFYNTNTSGTRVTNMELYPNNTVLFNNYATGGNSLRAPIFYDSADTGYYTDPRSTSVLWDLTLTGAKQTYLYINPGNGYEAMVRYNGGSGSGWYVGKRIASQLVGTESFHFYSEAAGQTVGGIDISGNIFARDSMRAPIFYDRDNTGYYADLQSTSIFNVLRFGTSTNTGRFDGSGTWGVHLRTDNGYIQFGPANNSHAHIYTDRPNFYLNAPITINDGSYINQGDIRSAIFYDRNDTGYYCDPNGTSSLGRFTQRTHAAMNRGHHWITPRFDYTGDTNYWTGTFGWGTSAGNWDNAWKSGFAGWDIWGGGTAHPQGGGYIHAQGIVAGQHYATSDGGAAYGWMMVGAHDAVANRYWARGKWGGGISGWREFVMSDSNPGYTLYAYILYDANNTGYYCDPASTSNMNAINCISFTETSSIRYKENVVSLNNSLDKILSLRGVTYNRKGSTDTEIGVIAEEVADIVPEIINFTKYGKADSVSYGRITALLIEAIKEQQQQINELKSLLGK
jgi:hypothetical protein